MSQPTRMIVALASLLIVSQGFVAYAHTTDKLKNKKQTIEVVNLNILHGFDCDPPRPGDGNQCRVRARINLLMQHIVAVGCPDLVTLQENVTSQHVQRTATEVVGPLVDTVALIAKTLPSLATVCGFTYRMVFDPAISRPPAPGRGIDEELILTRYPALAREVMPLYSPLAPVFSRHVLYARIAHPRGPVDVFTTHLAAESDLASRPCGSAVPLPPPFISPDCPAECAESDTVRECQAKQVVAFVEARHDVPEPAIISGDFNAVPGSNEYTEFTKQSGWIDSHLAAGNAECDQLTGENCTAGRVDDNLSDLQSPELNQTERIDFIFVVPSEAGAKCSGVILTSGRAGVTSTGLFAAEPNPFAPVCGAAPLPLCWPSDHSGNALTLRCRPSADGQG